MEEKSKHTGRPKTTVKQRIEAKRFDIKKIKKLAFYGLTDKDLCVLLEIDEMTLNRWKKDEEFMLALKGGKLEADNQVVRRLYERAMGYEHEDTYFSNYLGKVTATTYTKHYPPDPTALIFWLKNRQPDKFRDKQEIEHSGDMNLIINGITKV
jgi:hypothetical protein